MRSEVVPKSFAMLLKKCGLHEALQQALETNTTLERLELCEEQDLLGRFCPEAAEAWQLHGFALPGKQRAGSEKSAGHVPTC